MKHLKQGETYRIESLEDLFNCPNNMIDDCILAVKDGFKTRLAKEVEKGISLKMDIKYFTLTNDGINKTHIKATDYT